MSFALTRYDLGWPATRGGAVSGVTVSCAETVHQTVTSAGGRKPGAGKRIGVLRVGKLPRQDSNLRPVDQEEGRPRAREPKSKRLARGKSTRKSRNAPELHPSDRT